MEIHDKSKKRIDNILLFALFMLCSFFANNSFSQSYQKQSFRLEDTSLYAQDIILMNGDVFVLANMNEFEAIPPIEGTLNTGSAIVKLNEDLAIQWSATYQTATSPGGILDGGADGRVSAASLHPIAQEEILLPYRMYFGVNPCDSSSNYIAATYRIGLMQIVAKNGVISRNAVFEQPWFCDAPTLAGSFVKEDSIAQVLRFYATSGIGELIQCNDVGQLEVVNRIEGVSYWPGTFNKFLQTEDAFFILGGLMDSRSVLISKYSYSLDELGEIVITDPHFIAPGKLLLSGNGDRLLLLATTEDQSSGQLKSRLIEMDDSGTVFWLKNTERFYRDLVAFPNIGYLALSYQDSVTTVHLLNKQGEQQGVKTYVNAHDRPRKIVFDQVQQHFFILGEHQVRSGAEWEAARALYVLKDRFEITSTEAIVESSIEINHYPNPVRNLLTVRIVDNGKSPRDHQKKIVLKDVNGRVLLTTQQKSNKLSLDIESIPSGLYFVCIQIGEELIVQKIIKS